MWPCPALCSGLLPGWETVGTPWHRDEPGHRPLALWCFWQHVKKLLALGPPGQPRCWGPLTQPCRDREPGAPQHPSPPWGEDEVRHRGHPRGSPRTHRAGHGAQQPPSDGWKGGAQSLPGVVGSIPACLPWVQGSGCSPHPRAAESIPEMGNGSVSPWKQGHWLAMLRGHAEPRGHAC